MENDLAPTTMIRSGHRNRRSRCFCLHCLERYDSSEMKWDEDCEIWVCKNYEQCGGAGFGMDIHDATQNRMPGQDASDS